MLRLRDGKGKSHDDSDHGHRDGRKSVSLKQVMGEIAALEHDIRTSILACSSYQYFRMGQIKPAASYTLPPEQSNFAHYTFWNHTLRAQIRRSAGTTLQLGQDLCRSEVAREDQGVARQDGRPRSRFEVGKLVLKTGKKAISTFHVPEQIIQSKGIPKEIKSEIAIRKLITDTVTVFYIVLESLGIYMQNKQMTRLVSDHMAASRERAGSSIAQVSTNNIARLARAFFLLEVRDARHGSGVS